MENLREELEQSRLIIALTLVCALVAVYGGTSISYGEGTWFYFKAEFDAPDESDTEKEEEIYYTLDQIIIEGDETVNGTSEDLDDGVNYKSRIVWFNT